MVQGDSISDDSMLLSLSKNKACVLLLQAVHIGALCAGVMSIKEEATPGKLSTVMHRD